MKRLCKLGLDIVQERSHAPDFQRELSLIIKHRDELSGTMKQASHHLKEVTACRSMKDHLEYWNLYLHSSYVTSELYRSTLRRQRLESDNMANLRETCVDSLADTLEAFLGLQNLTAFAKTSWAAIHRALSSALLLAIMKEPIKNRRVHTLLEKFMTVMSDVNSDLGPSELPAPVSRSLSALRSLVALHTPSQSQIPGEPSILSTKGPEDLAGPSWSVEESPVATSSVSGSSGDNSPYAVRDRILWGSTSEHTPRT